MSDSQSIGINTLSEFISWIEGVRPKGSERAMATCFYRGHADIGWQWLSGVYRTDEKGNSFRANESRLYHEIMRRDPLAFAEDKNTFERLVRMQHYGLPTRLLDITQNPLIALFFACTDLPEKDGEVIAFSWPDSHISMHQRDLPPTSMAGVEAALDFSLLDKQVIKSFYDYLLREKNILKDLSNENQWVCDLLQGCIDLINETRTNVENLTDQLDSFAALKSIIDSIDSFAAEMIERLKQGGGGGEIENFISEKLANMSDQIFLYDLLSRLKKWGASLVARLCEQMKIPDQSTKQDIVDFLQALTVFNFVVPPLSNARIRRQEGAFVVFPPVTSKHWTLENACGSLGCKLIRASIKAGKKSSLLNDLANIGITRSHLFPELEEQAKHIKSLYPPSPDSFFVLRKNGVPA